MGTQKNHLNETVLFNTQNISLKLWLSKYLQFYEKFVVYLNLCNILNHIYRKVMKEGIYFTTKAYVVGNQKNRLNEMVLLSTQNISLKLWLRKYLQF